VERPGGDGSPEWTTAGIRDCWLEGSHHTAVDYEIAERILVGAPYLPHMVRVYRALLGRVVRYLTGVGVGQLLDLGSGLPTAGNVHEVARGLNPGCRVVYVDIDPGVVTEGRKLLAGDHHVAIVHADFRQPEQVLDTAQRTGLLDLGAPVAVLLIDVLHHIPDTDNPVRFIHAMLMRYVLAVMWLSRTPTMVRLSSVVCRCFTAFIRYQSPRWPSATWRRARISSRYLISLSPVLFRYRCDVRKEMRMWTWMRTTFRRGVDLVRNHDNQDKHVVALYCYSRIHDLRVSTREGTATVIVLCRMDKDDKVMAAASIDLRCKEQCFDETERTNRAGWSPGASTGARAVGTQVACGDGRHLLKGLGESSPLPANRSGRVIGPVIPRWGRETTGPSSPMSGSRVAKIGSASRISVRASQLPRQ
jgi:hypothetical protein